MRIGVLGCGSIGRRHLRNLMALGETDLVACDPAESARDHVAQTLAVPCVAALEALWAARPAAAVIATPPDLHVALALEAAGRGCDLFVEKPLGHALDGVERLDCLVRERGLVAMVGCNMRFHPGPAAVKRLLDDEAVGPVVAARIETGSYLPLWRPGTDYRDAYSADPARGGGAILDCIHEIDLALWYFGPGRVVAAATQRAEAIGLRAEGLAEMLVRHASGVLSSIHLNFVQRDYHRGCRVIGETGTLSWAFEQPDVVVRTGPDDERRHALPSDWQVNDMYLDEFAHFLECVRTRRRPTCGIADGAASLGLALDARAVASAAEPAREAIAAIFHE